MNTIDTIDKQNISEVTPTYVNGFTFISEAGENAECVIDFFQRFGHSIQAEPQVGSPVQVGGIATGVGYKASLVMSKQTLRTLYKAIGDMLNNEANKNNISPNKGGINI